MRYVPMDHVGTRDDRLRGMLEEVAYIDGHGFLRMHARDREIRRLMAEMAVIGGELFVGTEEDDGWILVRDATRPHAAACTLPDRCVCEALHRVRCNANAWK